MAIPARINLVTLGVEDVARATTFYTRLGFTASSAGNEQVSFFALGNVVLGLFGRAALAEDADIADDGGRFNAMALAINMPDKDGVDMVIAEAVEAGAVLVKPARDVFWGGYSGYFADPDGHLWEVAWNPFFPLDENGLILLPL